MTDNQDQVTLLRQVHADLLRVLNNLEVAIRLIAPPSYCDVHAFTEPVAQPKASPPEDRLTDRHYWILKQLGQGVRLTRRDVMEKFGYSERHTKRILRTLILRGLIAFNRDISPGHYVLRGAPAIHAC